MGLQSTGDNGQVRSISRALNLYIGNSELQKIVTMVKVVAYDDDVSLLIRGTFFKTSLDLMGKKKSIRINQKRQDSL